MTAFGKGARDPSGPSGIGRYSLRTMQEPSRTPA
jgi:hypothetical protein